MGNGLSARRSVLARPPVCKSESKDEYRHWPAFLILEQNWVGSKEGETTTYSGRNTAARLIRTSQYYARGNDDQGRAWVAQLTLNFTEQVSLLITDIFGTPPPAWHAAGEGGTWPMSVPFLGGPYGWFLPGSDFDGTWYYEFLGEELP
jgi:hypothetical protein